MQNLLGLKFGRWTVAEFDHRSEDGRTYWKCLCECGRPSIKRSDTLKGKKSKSCVFCRQLPDGKISRNDFINYENYYAIITTDGNELLIDKDDYPLLKQFAWYVGKNGYAASRINGKVQYLHRIIMGTELHVGTDHINGNKLDNRRVNLRRCNQHENSGNREKAKGCYTSKYKGVVYNKKLSNYRSTITSYHKQHHLGRYDNEIDAAIAYNKAALTYFGEFARLNDVVSNKDLEQVG